MRALFLVLLAGCAGPGLEEHVAFLAGEACLGRETGTAGERKAADYIEAAFRKAGLEVRVQTFQGHGTTGRNVIGIARGTSEEAVVIGAHYDHLGEAKGGWHAGADDNASGTAVLLALARSFAHRPAGRTVILAAFSGEEMGILGSRAYTREPVVLLDRTVAMINMDMVGRLRESLIVFGADSGDRFKEYLADSPVKIAHNRDPVGPSDHTSFYLKGVPAVHLFTGAHADYHKPSDTAEKVNYDGLRRVAALVETLARRIADAPQRMKFVKVEGAAPLPGGPRKGATPYLGLLPDYGHDGPGVKLAGVTPGSPADKAGFREDDVILQVDGRDCADVKAYSAEFFKMRPGDEIALTYERAGKRDTLKVKLAAKEARSDE
ncbi:MAG TPA: M28 family peptidase [Planctomycetota bacterium]